MSGSRQVSKADVGLAAPFSRTNTVNVGQNLRGNSFLRTDTFGSDQTEDTPKPSYEYSHLILGDTTNALLTAAVVVGVVAAVVFLASPPGWFVGAGILGTLLLVGAAVFIAKSLKLYAQYQMIKDLNYNADPKKSVIQRISLTYKKEDVRYLYARCALSVITNPLVDALDIVRVIGTGFVCGLSYCKAKMKKEKEYYSFAMNLRKRALESYNLQSYEVLGSEENILKLFNLLPFYNQWLTSEDERFERGSFSSINASRLGSIPSSNASSALGGFSRSNTFMSTASENHYGKDPQ